MNETDTGSTVTPGLAKIDIEADGMHAEHNFPCPICRSKPAVLNQSNGTFEPCWKCQRDNWYTIQLHSKILRWCLRKIGVLP